MPQQLSSASKHLPATFAINTTAHEDTILQVGPAALAKKQQAAADSTPVRHGVAHAVIAIGLETA